MIKTATRTRTSDGWHKYSITFLVQRITGLVHRTKTSGASDREEKALVGPIMSCTGLPWDSTYLRLRDEEGIPIETWPLMPALEKDVWINKNASLADVNRLYKEVVARVGEDTFRLTLHTWKPTGLTVAALDGVPRDQQSELAYHKLSTHKATRAYDQSRLEGLMPRYTAAWQAHFDKLGWTEDMTEKAMQTICDTGSKKDVWSDIESQSEVTSSEDDSQSETSALEALPFDVPELDEKDLEGEF